MKTKLTLSIVSLSLLASVAFAQTDLAVAPGLTPKSSLYFLDGVGEWIALRLTFNPIKKAEKKLQYASERLAELKKMEEENTVDKEAADKVKNNFERLANDAVSDVDVLKAQGRDVVELVQKMEDLSARHTAVLTEVLEKVPEQAKEAIERALEVSKRGHERAIEAIEKEVEEGSIKIEELEDELEKEVENVRKERKQKEELRPGSEIEELELEDEQDEIDDLTKEIEGNGLNDSSGEINEIEKSIK